MSINFEITLSGKEDVVLQFETYNRDYVKLYENSLIDSIANCKIIQPWRLYNFYKKTDEINRQVMLLNETIDKINTDGRIFIDRKIDSSLKNSDINYIHTFFVDSHLASINSNNDPLTILFSDLNAHLHGLEHILGTDTDPYADANFTIDFDNKKILKLPDDALLHFKTAKIHGECYVNYCQVGRHIFEVYNNQDEEAHDEHILPLTTISSSTYVWLGKSTGVDFDIKRMKDIKEWFIKNNIANKVGIEWGDPKLAIGWLPVAKLVSTLNLDDLSLVNTISNISLTHDDNKKKVQYDDRI